MNNKKADFIELYGFILFLLAIFISGMTTGIALMDIVGLSYEDGQIDALTGNVKYCLVENSKKETNWEECK